MKEWKKMGKITKGETAIIRHSRRVRSNVPRSCLFLFKISPSHCHRNDFRNRFWFALRTYFSSLLAWREMPHSNGSLFSCGGVYELWISVSDISPLVDCKMTFLSPEIIWMALTRFPFSTQRTSSCQGVAAFPSSGNFPSMRRFASKCENAPGFPSGACKYSR